MKNRWRLILFAVLSIFLVLGIDEIAVRENPKQLQSQQKRDALPKQEVTRNETKKGISPTTRIIPIYPKGDLWVAPKKPVIKPTIKKKVSKRKKTNPKKAKPIKKTKQLSQKKPLSQSREMHGDRPVLELTYKDIGFDRYLNIIERVGDLFVLVDTPAGNRLGPEVSLSTGILYSGHRNLNVLAVNRPHKISDEKIEERLLRINIPKNAITDSVVLILQKPYDELLWDAVSESLAKKNLHVTDVTIITGNYREKNAKIFLDLEVAVRKDDGKVEFLERPILLAFM